MSQSALDATIAFAVSACATISLAAAVWTGEAWQGRALDETRARATQQALALRAEWTRLFRQADELHALARLLTLQRANGASETVVVQTRAALDAMRVAAGVDRFLQVSAVDLSGIVQWSTLSLPEQKIDIADRDHFRAIVSGGLDTYISSPVFGRLSRGWVVQFARAVKDDDGRLIGVSYVSYQFERAERFLNDWARGPHDVHAIVRDEDGGFIATAFSPDVTVSRRSQFRHACKNDPTYRPISLMLRSPFDQRDRMHAAVCVPGTGSVAVVGLDAADALAVARADARSLLRLAALACPMYALIGVVLARLSRRAREARAHAAHATALLADQAMFRDLAENLGDTLVKIGGDFIVRWVNPAVRDLLGIAPAAFIGTSYRLVLHPEEHNRAAARRERLLASGQPDVDLFRYIRADNRVIWVELHAVCRRAPDTGEPYFYTLLRDVTEQHKLQLEMDRARAELDALITAGPAVLARRVIGADGVAHCRFVSPNAAAQLNLPPSPSLEANLDAMLSGCVTFTANHTAAFAANPGSAAAAFRFQVSRVGHPSLILHANIHRHLADTGETEEIYCFVNETGLVTAEAARVAAELRVTELLARSPALLYEKLSDPLDGERMVFVSENAEAITGHSRERLMDFATWCEISEPKEPDWWHRIAEAGRSVGVVRFEFRLRHRDGHWLTLLADTRTTPREGGAMLVTGALTDVTRQREVEQELRMAQDMLLAAVHAGPGVVARFERDVDGCWRAVWWSDNYVRMTGYSRSDWEQPDFYTTAYRADPRPLRGEVLAASPTPGAAHWEYDLRHKNGTWLRFAENLRLEPTGPDGREHLLTYSYDITPQHQAAQDLAEAKARLDTLLAASPGVLFEAEFSEDWGRNVTYVADAVERLTGWPAVTVIRRGLCAFFDPELAELRNAATRDAAATGEATFDARFRRADGDWMWTQASLRVVERDRQPYLTGFILDVTRAREADRSIAQLRVDLEQAVQAGPGALTRLRFDRAGKVDAILYRSAAIERMTGYTVAETLEPGWLLRVIDPTHIERVTRCDDAVRRGEVHTFQMRLHHKSGHWVWIEETMRPLETNGDATIIAVGYMLDITQRKLQELQLAQAAKLATLGEMATSMAHELNQPLAIMSMAAENAAHDLQHPDGAARALRRLNRIQLQARRASELIDHMRVFGRTRDDGITPVSLAAILADALVLASARLRQVGATIMQDLPDPVPLVLANAVLAEQVLVNLIANACDAYELTEPPAPPGRVIMIGVRTDGGTAILQVADHAGGIAADIIDRIFDPFFTTKTVGKGTGLGLSFSYGVMMDMGGALSAHNENGGAVFEMRLPLAPVADGDNSVANRRLPAVG